MAKFKNVYFAEITDTFRRRCLIIRGLHVTKSTQTRCGAVNKLSKDSGMAMASNSNYGDMMRYDSKSGATCFFICLFDEVDHGEYRLNEI